VAPDAHQRLTQELQVTKDQLADKCRARGETLKQLYKVEELNATLRGEVAKLERERNNLPPSVWNLREQLANVTDELNRVLQERDSAVVVCADECRNILESVQKSVDTKDAVILQQAGIIQSQVAHINAQRRKIADAQEVLDA
jgi:chromosome segregation ATPase